MSFVTVLFATFFATTFVIFKTKIKNIQLGSVRLNTFGFQFLNGQAGNGLSKMFTSLLLKGVISPVGRPPRTHRGVQQLEPTVAYNAP